MGAWTFVVPRFENLIGIKVRFLMKDSKSISRVFFTRNRRLKLFSSF